MMNVIIRKVTDWIRVVNAARKTSGKKALDHTPKDLWKSRILLSEHSPIRLLEFDIDIEGIRQWVTVHNVRHKYGIEHFVHSQREDRRDLGGIKRDDLPQGALNDMQESVNAQALINIARKRLCYGQPSPETQEVWRMVKKEMEQQDPVMASRMVPECIYRGFCPEQKPCGWCFTKEYERQLEEYRKDSVWREMRDERNEK